MQGGDAILLAQSALILFLTIAGPMLIASLVVGVVIGLLQALTQVQEMTLTFVPKMAAMLAVFWLSMGFMTTTLVAFFTDTLIPRIAGG